MKRLQSFARNRRAWATPKSSSIHVAAFSERLGFSLRSRHRITYFQAVTVSPACQRAYVMPVDPMPMRPIICVATSMSAKAGSSVPATREASG